MKTPQEEAEEMALKVAKRIENRINKQDGFPLMLSEYKGATLNEIPIPELLAVARAAAPILEGLDHTDIECFRNSHKGQVAMEISCGDTVAIHDALQSLRATGKVEEV